MPIIEVDHVSKQFQLGTLHSIKRGLKRAHARVRGHSDTSGAIFTALDDINFTVERGEVVGVIGHNGAGKSTLLKLLAGIMVPSRGRVCVHGKISPLIEVSSGLVGDLTGRENIFLNGAILGMPKAEIARKVSDIVKFAELEEFLDTPVKRYSSGMSLRLAFSIAISVEADILILDEILAVGDLAFQRKCFDRMESLIKHQGNTVIFVSHNVRQVERICSRAILLDEGRVVRDGAVAEVCSEFYDRMDRKIHAQMLQSGVPEISNRIRSTGQFVLEALRLIDSQGAAVDEISSGAAVVVELLGEARTPLRQPHFAVGIHTSDFIYLTAARSETQMVPADMAAGRFRVRCKIEELPLLPGSYALRLYVSEGLISSPIFHAENISPFRVTSTSAERTLLPFQGLFSVHSSWSPPERLCESVLN